MDEKITIRKANIEDLQQIQNLNKLLFELEFENYDSTLETAWPVSEEGTEYYRDAIENGITLVAIIDVKIAGYLIGSLNTQNTYNKYKQ